MTRRDFRTPRPHGPGSDRPRTDEAAGGEPIVIECDLAEPPEKVWRAVTEPALLGAWLLGTPPDGGPQRAPQRPTLEPLSSEPPRAVRYRWSEDSPGGRMESQVSFELTPAAGGGTHLRIVHGAFRVSRVIRMFRNPAPPTALALLRPLRKAA